MKIKIISFLLLFFSFITQAQNSVPQIIKTNSEPLAYVEYTHDGTKILSSTRNLKMIIWDAKTLVSLEQYSLDGYYQKTDTLRTSPMYDEFYSTIDGYFSVYSLHSKKLLYRKEFPKSYWQDGVMSFEEHGKKVIIAYREGGEWRGICYDAEHRKMEDKPFLLKEPADLIEPRGSWYSVDGSFKVSSMDRSINVYKNGMLLKEIYDQQAHRSPCALSPSNEEIVVGGKQLHVVNLKSEQIFTTKQLKPSNIGLFGLDRDKALLNGNGLYIGWDLKNGHELWRNYGHGTYATDTSPTPSLVMIRNKDKAIVQVYYGGWGGDNDTHEVDINTGFKRPLPKILNGMVAPIGYQERNETISGDLKISKDGRRLSITTNMGYTSVFDLESKQPIASFQGDRGGASVGYVSYPTNFMSDDGKILIHEGDDHRRIILLDIDHNTTHTISARMTYNDPKAEKALQDLKNKRVYTSDDISAGYSGEMVGLSPDGKLYAVWIRKGGKVRIYTTNMNLLHIELKDTVDCPLSVRFTRDGLYAYLQFYKGKELKISLVDGNTVATYDRETWHRELILDQREILSEGNGIYALYDRNLGKIAEFSSFEDGEWLIVTPQGYFNASSHIALSNLRIIDQHGSPRALTEDEIQHFYQPHTVARWLLTGKISKPNSHSTIKIPVKGKTINVACEAFFQSIIHSHPTSFVAESYRAVQCGENAELFDKITSHLIEVTGQQKKGLYYLLNAIQDTRKEGYVSKQLRLIPDGSEEYYWLLPLLSKEQASKLAWELYLNGKLPQKASLNEQLILLQKLGVDDILLEPLMWKILESNETLNYPSIKTLEKKDKDRLFNSIKSQIDNGIIDRTYILTINQSDSTWLKEKMDSLLKAKNKASYMMALFATVQDNAFIEPLLEYIQTEQDTSIRYKYLRIFTRSYINNSTLPKLKEAYLNLSGPAITKSETMILEDKGIKLK